MGRRLLAILSVVLLPAAATAQTPALRPLPSLLHAHSTLTTGELPLDRLLADSRAQGLEAVLLTENYLLKVEYGLWPFRRATRVTRQEASVLTQGLEGYLAQVAAARRRFPDMVILPGVEVVPHYRWTGTPFTGDLTVHDLQKNLLVFGITDPARLRRLPSSGNPNLGRYTPASVVELLPGLLVVPGLWLSLVKRRRIRRVGGFTFVERRRRWLAGIPLTVLGLAALWRAFPFTEDPWSPYRPDLELRAAQALIDQVDAAGGATVWSFPEARDSWESDFLGLRVRVQTDPYPNDLARTFRYTAFGAVYEDTTRVAGPGGLWDYLLGKYLADQRSRPPWIVGEAGFHAYVAGKRPQNIQTVFLVPEKSESALLASFRAGRMYALSRTPAYQLVLGSLTVRQGDAVAGLGETLRAAPAEPLEVRAAVEASDGGAYPVRAIVVRNGQVAQVWTELTPLRLAYREPAPAGPAYYRLEVRGPVPHQILSNPVFVRPRPGATP